MTDLDRSDVMLAAIRYAMPRQSYIGSSIRSYVVAHMHEWPQVERDRLAIVIDEAAADADALGDPRIDRPAWLDLRDALRRGEGE